MKCGVASVLCFLIVCVYQSDSFKIIQKIKDYFHSTTPTTTVTPILNEYETEGATTAQINAYDSYTPEDHYAHDSEDSLASKYPYTPENFPTIAPPDVAEVYPGMTKHSTTPRPRDNETTAKEQTNVDYDDTVNQEVLTTPQTSYGLYDQTNTEQTALDNIEDSNLPTTTSRTTVQPGPTNNQTSSKTHSDNFVFPDDPLLNEAEVYGSRRSKNSVGDRVYVPPVTMRPKGGAPVPVGDDGGRHIFDAPSTNCGQGRQLDGKGVCRQLARKLDNRTQ